MQTQRSFDTHIRLALQLIAEQKMPPEFYTALSAAPEVKVAEPTKATEEELDDYLK